MIKQLLVSSCVLFSATFVVQAQNPKLGVSPIQDVINAMTLDEKIQLVVGSTGKYESKMEAAIGNQSLLVKGAAGQVNGIERLGIPVTVVADGPAGLRIDPKPQEYRQDVLLYPLPCGYCDEFYLEQRLGVFRRYLYGRRGEALWRRCLVGTCYQYYA